MAETPSCCDGPNELLRKILLQFISFANPPDDIISTLYPGPFDSPTEIYRKILTGLSLVVTPNMPILPECCDGPNELLRKILLQLGEIEAAITPSGNVNGPGFSIDGDLALFDGATGTLIKDSGINITDVVTNANFESGSEAIGLGVDTITVVFPTAFTSVPSVVGTISRPVAEGLIEVNIDEASITVTGFTASLSAMTGSANYILKWMAKE